MLMNNGRPVEETQSHSPDVASAYFENSR